MNPENQPSSISPGQVQARSEDNSTEQIRAILKTPIILGEITLASPETQTTVGAAGTASALPAAPTGYLKLLIGTTEFAIPYYEVS